MLPPPSSFPTAHRRGAAALLGTGLALTTHGLEWLRNATPVVAVAATVTAWLLLKPRTAAPGARATAGRELRDELRAGLAAGLLVVLFIAVIVGVGMSLAVCLLSWFWVPAVAPGAQGLAFCVAVMTAAALLAWLARLGTAPGPGAWNRALGAGGAWLASLLLLVALANKTSAEPEGAAYAIFGLNVLAVVTVAAAVVLDVRARRWWWGTWAAAALLALALMALHGQGAAS